MANLPTSERVPRVEEDVSRVLATHRQQAREKPDGAKVEAHHDDLPADDGAADDEVARVEHDLRRSWVDRMRPLATVDEREDRIVSQRGKLRRMARSDMG